MATANGSNEEGPSHDAGETEKANKFTNRLAQEKSPYLLQHAHNPVDWYPWGAEAFQKAKQENKPIFLSVGYSTCHWCHVMERESFENEDIAQVMNEHFVNVKVDREERPDVDSVYMTFVQATSGGGGWPMSVWLTPDLHPLVGGTYFPPEGRYFGRPGFKTVLESVADRWNTSESEVKENGAKMLEALRKITTVKTAQDAAVPDAREVFRKGVKQLGEIYDKEKGGFGKAPKFPQPVFFNFLMRAYAEEPEIRGRRILHMIDTSLKFMGRGGIHDHVAQGFHRYSTDIDWHVPHFEKMLYDQGQLAVCFANAYQITKNSLYRELAYDIFQYVNRDLSDKSGGFYSAEDADSLPTHESTEKREGAFCVWTHNDVSAALPDSVFADSNLQESDVFCYHYTVRQSGNVDPFQDPHDELKEQNVLIERGSIKETADKFGLTEERAREILQTCREKLRQVRLTRPKPHLDNKILTAWNGYMISGFARGAQVFGDPALTERATSAAQFLRNHAYNKDTGVLYRSTYISESGEPTQLDQPIEGFVSDYASLVRALIDLYEAGLESKWLEWAEALQRKQDELFWDDAGGSYYSTSRGDSSILVHLKDDQDGAEPSANSVSCENLLRLASLVDSTAWQHAATRILGAFSETLRESPVALSEMACALRFLSVTPKQIIIAGDRGAKDTEQLLRCVHAKFMPNKVLILADGASSNFLYDKLSVLSGLERKDNKATAYVCENYTCKLPVNSAEELDKLL